MNELATDAPLTKALTDEGPPALIAELKAQGMWEFSQAQDPESYNTRPEMRRFAQAVVNQAKLDAQRIKQIAWNNPKMGAAVTHAKPIVDALAGIYGHMYLRADSVGLKVRCMSTRHPKDLVGT